MNDSRKPDVRTLRAQVRYTPPLPPGLASYGGAVAGWTWRIVLGDEVYTAAGTYETWDTEAEAKAAGEAVLTRINAGEPLPTEWHDV